MNLGGGGLPRPRPPKGLLFDRASIKRAGCLFPFVLASAVGLAAACAGLGWALTSIDGLTAYLATTPGGIDSVAIMALASGADTPLVFMGRDGLGQRRHTKSRVDPPLLRGLLTTGVSSQRPSRAAGNAARAEFRDNVLQVSYWIERIRCPSIPRW
jgi:Transition state regulatory protein AbrB